MLYHSRYTAEADAYFMQLSCRLDGALDPALFERAWQRVLDRHTALRTSFHWRELERPLQVVHRRATVPFAFEDWRPLAPAEQSERFERLLARDRQRGFDLARPPLLRLTLCQLADTRYRLVWTFHHLLFDGWSMPLVIQEVLGFYAAAERGEELQLPRPRPYRDFILWQQRQDVAAAEAFWRQALAGFTAPTPLVLGAASGDPEGGGVGRVVLPLGGALFAGLQELGRSCQLTVSTLVQGAWALLLARSSGEEDVLFGVTSAGRPADLPGSADMVGLFINTLPARVRVPLAEPLLPWLQRLQRLELRMREHEHSPLVRIQGWSEVPRGVPLFESIVVFEGFAVESSVAREEATLAIGEVQFLQKTNFPLALNASPEGERLRLRLTYDRRRFAEGDIRRAFAHLAVLLAAMVENPERCLGDLPLTTAAERHQIESEWNDAPSPDRAGDAGGATISSRLAAQTARTPDAVAVVDGDTRLTYGELAARAARVERPLRAQGVGPGVRVGLSLERSPELVAGLLGILAAGGTYVPIDPVYPAERQAFMRRDAGLAAVVDEVWIAASDNAARVAPPRTPSGTVSGPGVDDPLYVIYTSGSTGQPKGAVVRQGAFSALVDWYVEELRVSASDRLLLLSSASFDLTQKNFFAPLLVGAELHLAPSTYDPAELRAAVERQGITQLNCTPSAFYPLAEEGDPAALASLRLVILGGEPIAVSRLDRWRRSGSCRATVLNSYGPTECTDVVAFHRLAPPDRVESGAGVPLGRPIPGVRLWIQSGIAGAGPESEPIGVPGELWIGGECVGCGYWGDPVRTAQKFLPDPSPHSPGARAYRTGDLARRLPGGEIDYLGRIDHQVKVRGFRIELGEIEAALAAHPAVREAVVAARGERLVAYVVARREGAPPSGPDLHRFLAARLPEPMLPGLFVPLAALPLTPSGKVDRRALPDPEPPAGPVIPGVAPSGDLEIYLAGLFRDVLKIPAGVAVGAEDDFFALGGHSIVAAVLINRLQEKLGAILYAVAIFDAPTVSRLAEYLVDNYPEAVTRVFGETALGGAAALRRLAELVPPPRIDGARIDDFRRAIVPLPPRPLAEAELPRNRPAVFVLSPPRSGSTLLRVMLAGHPRLFAPPELELLSFNTLAERRAAFPGRNAFWLEGTVRAVIELRQGSAEHAEAELARFEREGRTTRDLYRQLQEWIGDRVLVDKTPSYALDRAVLERAEETFEGARYIHLLRHPYGMIHSFEEAKLEQVFFRHPHTFSRRELAELIWWVSQENILGFLTGVPRERQLRVHFEDLLASPVPVLEEICAFLGLDFHPDMARPYEDQGERRPRRMTDGIHAWSRMLGDVKFLQHGKVDPAVAQRWRDSLHDLVLGEETVALAESLGYPIEPLGRAPEAARVAIPRRPAGRPTGSDAVPLSFAQERLWFLDRMQAVSVAYNLPAAVRLRGALDPAAFHRALAEVVRRHESLRTTFGFTAEAAGPVQRIAPEQIPALPRIDLRGLSSTDRETEVLRLALEDARRPFDLAAGPLLRAALLAISAEPGEHVVLFDLHHIVADGRSIGVLLREIAALYGAFSAGLPSPLPDLPVQYPDFALWQRSWLTGAVLAAETDYWVEALRGVPALELPTDLPRPLVRSERGGLVRRRLPGALGSALGALAEREKATRFMVLLAGWGALLSRIAGQLDLAIGVPVAGRTRPEIEGLIGFFVNTLVLRLDLRLDLHGAPGFRALVARARQVALGAYAHQELPFEKIVEVIQPPRDPSRSPLFQVMLAFQNADSVPGETVARTGLVLEPIVLDSGSAKFDLSLSVQEGPDGELALRADYGADLFLASTIARHLGHLEVFLAAAVADPERPFVELPLLAPPERHQIEIEWNATPSPGDAGGATLAARLAAQAARTPDAVALVFDGEARLTYGALAARAARLGSRLRAEGVGPGARVGLSHERSPELVVGLLGILAAGGTYVPIDPTYPVERQAFMREDAGLVARVPGEGLGAGVSMNAASDPAGLDAPLYVIYTSGSTGRPKGAVVRQRAFSGLLDWYVEELGMNAADRQLLLSSASFDLTQKNFFAPLLVGAELHLAPSAYDPAGLRAYVERHGITRLNCTPSAFYPLAEEGDPAALASLLSVVLGGEPIAVGRLDRWRRSATCRAAVLNSYGPTECTDVVAFHRLAPSEEIAPQGGPPLGRPIPGVRVWIQSGIAGSGGEPAPIGVAGELWIGGECVGGGYLGDPARTAERFLPDPASETPGARVYRTGDLARRRPDGEIDSLGRLDHQVKVRGFRLEPGEIEAALGGHPAVREAAVVARGETLVAYVVGRDGTIPADADLRSFLAARLPEPMLPSLFVTLPVLPLTPSGKVDRRALPDPGLPTRRVTATAPAGELQVYLAGLFRDVLKLPAGTPVHAEDDFFALGGHSIAAAVLINRLQEKLGTSLYAVALFEAPTVSRLAAYLEAHRPSRSPLVPLVSPAEAGPGRPLFLIHPAGGHVFCYLDLARQLGPDRPVYGLATPPFAAGDRIPALEERAATYVEAIVGVQPQGPYALGGWSLGGVFAWEVAQQLRRRGSEVELLALLDTEAPDPTAASNDQADLLAALAGDLEASSGRPLAITAGALRQLPESERLNTVFTAARQAGAIPADVGEEAAREHLRALEANVTAAQEYRPQPYPGRVLLVSALRRREVARTLGWGALAVSGLEVVSLDTDHRGLLVEPVLADLVLLFRARLESAALPGAMLGSPPYGG